MDQNQQTTPCNNTSLGHIVPVCSILKHRCSSSNLMIANAKWSVSSMTAGLVRLYPKYSPNLIAERGRRLVLNVGGLGSGARWRKRSAGGHVS